MLMVLVSALAAALITLWIGEHAGLASYHHLLATLPAGARLREALSLGARSAIAIWPLAAGLMAGGMELAAVLRDRQTAGVRVGAGPGMTGAGRAPGRRPGAAAKCPRCGRGGGCAGPLRTLGGCFPGLICADRRLPS